MNTSTHLACTLRVQKGLDSSMSVSTLNRQSLRYAVIVNSGTNSFFEMILESYGASTYCAIVASAKALPAAAL